MRTKHIPSIELNVQSSYLVLGWYLLISIVSVVSITYLPVTRSIQVLASSSALLLALYIILRDALVALPWSWRFIRISPSGQVALVTRAGVVFHVTLAPTTVCHPYLVVLRFRQQGRLAGFQSSAYLTPFRVQNTDQLRKLRMWLRWAVRPTLNKNTNASVDVHFSE
jgi:hypothetical protein